MTTNSLKNLKFCRMQKSLFWEKAMNQSILAKCKHQDFLDKYA